MLGGDSWQAALKAAVRDPDELCRRLDLPESFAVEARRAAAAFPVFAPQAYIDRMRRGDPFDPLLRQVLPVEAEMETPPGFATDPVGDGAARLLPGLLQKYDRRVLWVATGACAVHCRYCFRRHYPYEESPRSPDEWQGAIDRLAGDSSIDEVIWSGGDPLTLVDERLADLAERLATVPHLRRLRIHTRLPIVLPQRVTPELLRWLRGTRLVPYMVIHANHPHELAGSALDAIGRLRDAGVTLLNQSVLLRGVNDSLDVLVELSLRLVDHGVLPYYLHQLDRVAGAAHFEVPEETGRALAAGLRERLPGYATPRYVVERAGAASKTVLA